jgi:hypothetical protein
VNRIIRCGLASTVLATVLMTNARAEDPVAAWNQISENAVKAAGAAPPVALDLDMHWAIYDAVESIDRRHEPYYTLAPNATRSLSAAAAKSGHEVIFSPWPDCTGETAKRTLDLPTPRPPIRLSRR